MLITTDELARGLCLVVFGSLAGGATLTWPGSPLWMLPAAIGTAGCALTVPEVREEVARALPVIIEQTKALPATARRFRTSLPITRGGTKPSIPADAEAAPPVDQADPLLHALNTQKPHRIVIGHSDGGKTTLLHGLTHGWVSQGLPVLVCDPDASPGQWPGCRVVGGGDNYDQITQALEVVSAEITKRRTARAQGQRRFKPMHLVLDEVQDIFAECPAANDLFETIARRGRKIGVHVTLGVQDSMVGTLKLERKSHLLHNLLTADVMLNEDGQRVAIIKHASGQKQILPVPILPDPELMIAPRVRPVRPNVPPSPSDAALLTSLINDNAVSPHPNAEIRPSDRRIITTADNNNTPRIKDTVTVDTASPSTVNVNVAQYTGTGRSSKGTSLDIKTRRKRHARTAQIRTLIAQGKTFEAIYQAVGGNRNAVHAEYKQMKKEQSS